MGLIVLGMFDSSSSLMCCVCPQSHAHDGLQDVRSSSIVAAILWLQLSTWQTPRIPSTQSYSSLQLPTMPPLPTATMEQCPKFSPPTSGAVPSRSALKLLDGNMHMTVPRIVRARDTPSSIFRSQSKERHSPFVPELSTQEPL